MSERILIAGIGNIFLGDDGFGVEVAGRLAGRAMPEGVRVADYGIRGFDLAYALMDPYDAAILVDAMPRGDVPGTLYVVEPDMDEIQLEGGGEGGGVSLETHGMNPARVLQLVKTMGGAGCKRILVVGCEPFTFGSDDDEGYIGLSEPVRSAVDEAVKLVESLVGEILNNNREAEELKSN
ncbi:MAG: hydrogenase maturation protease [Deltaproteobacteria bacterium]